MASDIQKKHPTMPDATATTRTRSNSTLSSPLPPPPDGGLRAWTQVAAGWLVLFATWGYLNSFGSFQSYYTATALPTHSPSSISWIGSVQACLTTAIGAFTGRLLDAGYFRPTFAIGAALQLTGMFAMSAASDGDSPKYWHLMLTQGVLSGVGAGILFTPSMALVATWFGKRRGLAIGLATTGNSMGGIVYPVIVQQLIPRVGFAWTARALGFVNLACFGLALALMRTRLPPRRSGPVIDWSAFGEGVYVAYVAALFFFCWANYYTFYYIASFGIESLGLSYGDAAFLVVIVNGAGLPARILVPMLSDRIGPLNVMSMSMICIATVITCWLAVSDIPGLYAFTAVCGLVSGAVQSLMPTTVASITRRLDTVGTRLGMCFSILSVASLTGPPIGGALQSASGGSFTGAQAWAAVSALLGAAFVVLARGFRVGWKPREKC
ncbi:MFS general substrate transporter [Sodiomyces alkalinus F11]|uniref:MFS general substrate transporter n=1 Tax=Sodiomyces alkalinus (strain CBS 110278 / VKM F-3762 / F11) TaxID=1314773 RepID=A0A3N2Q3F0_SODAK|nr:MFS general substrate transporter [Sodiomyces alkalinus F11]ROT41301.1 MFS general substrate transporter [Sodiomyces alkalinus F11]